MTSLRAYAEDIVRDTLRVLGVPEEYARVTYGPPHPLNPRRVDMKKPKPKPTRRPKPGGY